MIKHCVSHPISVASLDSGQVKAVEDHVHGVYARSTSDRRREGLAVEKPGLCFEIWNIKRRQFAEGRSALRVECPNKNLFKSSEDARQKIEAWRTH